MFKALITALAITLTGLLYAATPDPAAWYRPLDEDYLPSTEWIALMYLEDSRGALHEVEYGMYIDPQTGEVINSGLQAALSDLKLSLNTVVDVLDETTMTAVENAWDIERLDAQFTSLGKNLTKVFQVDGMKFNFEGKTYRFTIPEGSLRSAIQNNTQVTYNDEDNLLAELNDAPDEKTITKDNDKKLSLKNKPLNKASVAKMENGILKWEDLNPYLVISNDLRSLETNKKGEWEIKGWAAAKPEMEYTLGDVLSGKHQNVEDDHLIVRSSSSTLDYVKIGKFTNTNNVVEVDEKSITKVTETSESGEKTTKLALMGFKDAGGTKDSPAVPFSGEGDNLMWQSFLTFFNGNMFESKNGKINLKGLDADEKEVRILTVKAGTDGAAVTSDSMKTFIDPPLEWLNNKITVSGYDVAQEGEYLCRSASGVTWKKVEDGILADEKAITTNAAPFEAFTLVGYGNAEENMIPFKDASTLNWQKINDFLDTAIDRKSIALNSEKELEVKGASSVSSPRKYFGSSTTSSLIGWWDLPNVTTNRVDVDEITLTTDNTADGKVKTIRWKTTPLSVPSLAKMGGNGIEWVPYDGITNQNAIVGVDDISVATNDNGKLEIKGWANQASCGADLSKMLTDEGDSNRDDHEILCRVGGQIHYLPLSKGVINVPKVDGDTLVEKGDGTIGLSNSFGVEDGAVPHRVAGGLEWKKVNDIIGDEETIAIDEDSEGTKTVRWMSKPGSSPSLAMITENGLEWESIDNITNNLVSAMLTDGVTIVTNGNGEAAIKGFADQEDCSADFARMLADPNYGDRDDHAVLCRYGKGDSATIHYLPFKDFMATHIADEETLHAKEDGKLELVGFPDADDGYVPTRSGSSLEWKKFPEIKAGNGVTVTPTDNGDYEVSATNVCECTRHDPPNADGETIIDNDGVWSVAQNYLNAEGVTNAVNAAVSNGVCKVDGITIIKDDDTGEIAVNQGLIPTVDGDTIIEKSDGTIGLDNSYNAPDESVPTRSGTGLTWVEPTEATFVVDVIWDEQTKTIKKKTATYKIYGTLLTEDEDYQ